MPSTYRFLFGLDAKTSWGLGLDIFVLLYIDFNYIL